MTTSSFTPMVSGQSRIFIIEGQAGPSAVPSYESCMAAGAPTQSFGDVTKIECPDPNRYGKWIDIGEFRGTVERPTVDIMGRYARDLRSKLLRLAQQGCPLDIAITIGGECKDPSIFNTGWEKILYLPASILTNWSPDNDLGSLGSDGQNPINETSSVSARSMFEVLPLSLVERAGSVISNELLDGFAVDGLQCPGCGVPGEGHTLFYFVSDAAGGSPSTAADVVYSLTSGASWAVSEVDSLGSAESPTGIAKVGSYVVVVSNDSASLHYVLQSELNTTGDETWQEVSTGFETGGEPNDIWSTGNKAFVVGDGGYIYSTIDPTAGVTALDEGSATTDDLNAVHAINEDFAIAVGNAGAILKTTDGVQWQSLTRFVGVGVNLTCCWMLDKNIWFVGGNDGKLYYTEDGGTTWSEKTFPGSGSGEVRDIAFSTRNVGYLSHSTATPAGRVLRTISGGNSWYVLPEGASSIPSNDRVTALAVPEDEANLFAGGGLADDGSDGFLVVGS